MSEEVKKQFVRLIGVLIVGTCMISAALAAYHFVNAEDEYKVVRSLVERTAVVTAGFCFILFGLCVIDFVTPHDYLTKIEENPIACAILGGAVVYSLAMLFCVY